MDITRLAQDEVLVLLDEPIQKHLQEELEKVAAQAATPRIAGSRGAGETTPLVLKAGSATAYVDVAVDLSALDRKYQEEEREALREDQRAPTFDTAQDETISLWKMSVPMTVSTFVKTLAGIAMGMLLGNVSGELSAMVIAASSLSDVAVGQVSATLLGGMGIAVDTMCTQSFGAKQYAQIWLFAQAGLIAMVYCVPFIVVAFANGSSILVFLGQDPRLASLAGFFMRFNLLSLPFSISLSLMTSALVAQGIVVPLTIASFVAQAVVIPLAYVLGYKTSLGYVGILVASFINVVIQNVIVGRVLWKNSVFISSWPGWQLKQAHGLVKKLWPLGISSILMVAVQNLGLNIVQLICGLLPNAATAISSSTIGMTWVSLALTPLTGFFSGGAVRVGNALGAGRPRRAMIAGGATLASMFSVALVALVLCATFADRFTHAYTTDEATAKAATNLIYVLLPMILLTACVFSAQAVLRACAKPLVSAQINFVAMLVIGIPVGYFLGFQLSWGVAGLWTGQILGFAIFSITAGVFIMRLDWKQLAHAARLNAHLHVEKATDEPSPEPHVANEA